MLHCGLVNVSLDYEPTVEEIFEYAGLGIVVESLPFGIPGLAAVFNIQQVQRNAVWFNTARSFETILRLHFQLDSTESFRLPLQRSYPGFEITEADKKVLLEETSYVVNKDTVDFAVECTISGLNMVAGINFRYDGITNYHKFNPSQSRSHPRMAQSAAYCKSKDVLL